MTPVVVVTGPVLSRHHDRVAQLHENVFGVVGEKADRFTDCQECRERVAACRRSGPLGSGCCPADQDTPRGLGNRSGQLGRNVMFHIFTLGIGIFADDLHAARGPSSTFTIDDFVGPDRSAAARKSGQPYFKGGICEVGGGLLPLAEAELYTALPGRWGRPLKAAMRASR